MKRIEIFEEGIFLTFGIDSGRIRVLDMSGEHYNENSEHSVPNGAEELTLLDYKDTGNQTGRLVEVSGTRPADGRECVMSFQFYKGEAKVTFEKRFAD